ncbi:SDR family NAD(P)-dependent oxidoreductase [Haliea sp. E1-2-M8]|uniref:SDR family NAD(P)-dependent oxidoreductase n=1 Tax=Haliea sp. E1-2-M8 TaxID=3064706 RepID=UPI00271594E6|nr:SDR family NAD(P)-dependent oxidoreductase [Haliea sp. E1-2-M8]MDO8864106.1 SDR family NAD(P)-dependent oxidoreductase [Haliea sp. E1-2-M8]
MAADRLNGRRAFVTGGAKGIGLAIVERLVAEGCEVIFSARDMEPVAEVVARTGARTVQLDVSDLPACHRVVSDNGPFDILVNNAGMDQHAFFTKTAPDEWDYLIDVNLKAVLATCHAALPSMQERGFGRIINIGSEAGRQGSRGGSVYAAAKGGVIAFTKSLARENGRFGITANVIAPGPVDTPLLRSAVAQGGEELLKAMKRSTLVGRLGRPDEVASAVAYLAADDAGFITGEAIGVSGGMGC